MNGVSTNGTTGVFVEKKRGNSPHSQPVVISDDFPGHFPEPLEVPPCYAGEFHHILLKEDDIQRRLRELAHEVNPFTVLTLVAAV